jgi:2-polyprenyl-6-methoxyphenol hydroxylase-like FAD-dependent oxidoreductase
MASGTGEAVVIGAGIAGLSAARVLSDRFARVTLVDRDALPDAPDSRRGVPQGAHPHALLAVGRDALEELFPGLTDELTGRGAVWVDIAGDALLWQLDGYRCRFDSGVHVVSLTRPLLETCVRQRVAALPNVTIRTGTAVGGLTGEPGMRVTGVELDGAGTVEADLVVDASGRGGARSDHWLRALGFPTPQVSTVTMRMAYGTRLLRHEPGDADCLLAIAAQTPPGRRFGGAFRVEGDRWQFVLGGWHGDHAPTDDDGYRQFAKSLPMPVLAELLDRAEPLTPVVSYQYPAARRRHFERLRRVPAGYVVVGDAGCSFNPAYGQGMTVAALEALALGRSLDRHGGQPTVAFVRDYYRQAARLTDVPWDLASGADFAYPETEGRRPLAGRLLRPYMRRVVLASHVSPEVHRTLLGVQHLLAPPSVLLRPGTVRRALRAAPRSPAYRTVIAAARHRG